MREPEYFASGPLGRGWRSGWVTRRWSGLSFDRILKTATRYTRGYSGLPSLRRLLSGTFNGFVSVHIKTGRKFWSDLFSANPLQNLAASIAKAKKRTTDQSFLARNGHQIKESMQA